MVMKNTKITILSLSILLVVSLFVSSEVMRQKESREAVAIKKRCLLVAKETRDIFDETATYSRPFYYHDSTQIHYLKNKELLTGIDAFVGCIENDHAFSEKHLINHYREDALTASTIISNSNMENYSKICPYTGFKTFELSEWCAENKLKREP